MNTRPVRLLFLVLGAGLLAGCLFAVADRPVPPRALGWAGDKVLVEFTYRAKTAVKSVHVAGSFNGWMPPSLSSRPDRPEARPIALRFDKALGAWRTVVALEPGSYQYKYILDGFTWVEDPAATERMDD